MITNPGKRIPLVQEQLKSKGIDVNTDEALAVSRHYEELVWGVHKWIGYGIALLLLSRIVIEILQPAEEKVRSRFIKALAFGRNLGISRELRGIIKETHAIVQYLMYAFVVIHLIGVIYTDIKRSNGLISGMFNGNKK